MTWVRYTKPPAKKKRTIAGPVRVYRNGQPHHDANKRYYAEYLKQENWRARRGRLAKDECLACGATENLHLHHKTYERVGREKPWDLVTLCASCHTSIHAAHRASKGKSLSWVTDQFVAKRRRGT